MPQEEFELEDLFPIYEYYPNTIRELPKGFSCTSRIRVSNRFVKGKKWRRHWWQFNLPKPWYTKEAIVISGLPRIGGSIRLG